MPPRSRSTRSRSRSRTRAEIPTPNSDATVYPAPVAPTVPSAHPLRPRFFHLILLLLIGPLAVKRELQDPLTFFNVLNVLICYWELLLIPCLPRIQGSYEELKRSPQAPLAHVVSLFLHPLPPNPFSPLLHCKIWSHYSLYDPSYSDQFSFGFWIDAGNGLSTVIPTVIMIAERFGVFGDEWARFLGFFIGMSYWQMLYGTLVYFTTFFFNRRHKDHKISDIIMFVAFANGLWIFGPILGIGRCWSWVETGSFI
ncbi:hypothetical protein TrVE_jg2216 [Triparma verrucosa]|uniref:Uncharacterized protein n=2 Tax=Triparma TaxID=722752 RepID=A0A9W7ENM4_9STRA|nr:hypothetical protein TrST_g9399 [Triparma strigata]GMH87267.1 hypothetical protein TrVE_jg2216 [Triparma verrucosa]